MCAYHALSLQGRTHLVHTHKAKPCPDCVDKLLCAVMLSSATTLISALTRATPILMHNLVK